MSAGTAATLPPAPLVKGKDLLRLPKGSIRRAAVLELQRRCWELRLGNMTYDQIAQALDISRQSARNHCQRAMRHYALEVAESAHVWVDQEVARLDSIMQRLWTKRGDPRASDSLMRAIELKMKLRGALVERRELSGPNGRPIPVAAATFDMTKLIDPSKLSVDQLRTLDALLAAGAPVAGGGDNAERVEGDGAEPDAKPVEEAALPDPGAQSG